MTERRYQNAAKAYIKVASIFYPDGRMEPVAFWWESGQRYPIDRVVSFCRASSLKAGGSGIRYTCRVHGRLVDLFFEEDRWFIERKGAT